VLYDSSRSKCKGLDTGGEGDYVLPFERWALICVLLSPFQKSRKLNRKNGAEWHMGELAAFFRRRFAGFSMKRAARTVADYRCERRALHLAGKFRSVELIQKGCTGEGSDCLFTVRKVTSDGYTSLLSEGGKLGWRGGLGKILIVSLMKVRRRVKCKSSSKVARAIAWISFLDFVILASGPFS
jgi:hypothetical protein